MDAVQAFEPLPGKAYLSAGGKDGMLARSYRTGYNVSEGFVILPSAFSRDELRPDAWSQAEVHLDRMRGGYSSRRRLRRGHDAPAHG